MSDDGRIVTKKVRAGTLDIDPNENVLIVNCFIETIVSQDGEPVSRDRKPQQKVIPVDLPTSYDDCILMAEDLVSASKYILKAQQPQVEQLLYQLYQRGPSGGFKAELAASKDDGEEARMENLEIYLEMLYEHQDDLSEKIKGTAMILWLTHEVGNLEVLVQDHPLMGALSRVLNDDFRKSMELTYNIMRIFLAFSNFVEMHDILANYRVGSVTMKVVEMELKKAVLRDEERKKRQSDEGGGGASGAGSVRDSVDSINSAKGTDEAKPSSKEDAKARILAKKQDKLLFVSLYLLLNLASDTNVEKKMIKKKLTDYLIALLDRVSYDLLLLVVTFLKKLSVYEENIEQIRASNLMSKVVKFIPCSHDRLSDLTLRLLFNLSFDPVLREQMVKNPLIPRLIELLKKPPFRAKTLKLLYQISIDDRCKSMFTYTEAIPLVKELILNFPRNMLTQELGALAINLTWNDRNAEMLVQKGGLKRIMDRMMDKKDPLLMKVIRNISNWTLSNQFELNDPQHEYRFRSLWPPHIKSLVSLMLDTESNDVLIEVVGTLGNLTLLDLPLGTSWKTFIQDYDLLSFCKRLLVPGMSQTDIILEVIILIGAFALDPAAASELANANIVRTLHDVWSDKNDDAEVVLQSLFTFYRLLRHPETRESMLYVDYKDKKNGVQQTRIVLDILGALSHRNLEVRKAADMCLDLIMECDRGNDGLLKEMGVHIRRRRFEAQNMEWCELVEQEEQMMCKEGSYQYGGSSSSALISSIKSPTSYDETLRRGSSGNSSHGSSSDMYLRGEKVAMRMDQVGGGGTPSSTSRRQSVTKHYDEEEDDDDDDDNEDMMDADRKYTVQSPPGNGRNGRRSSYERHAGAKSPVY